MRNKKSSKSLKDSYTQFNFYRGFYKAELKKNTELSLISIKRRVVRNTVRICHPTLTEKYTDVKTRE